MHSVSHSPLPERTGPETRTKETALFQRVLVPLDGSARALQALPVAAHLARVAGGSVIVVRVVSPLLEGWPTLDFSQSSPPVQTILERDLAEAERYVAEITASPYLGDVTTETIVLVGSVTPTILSVASTCRADLIVMGGHRATGRAHWLNGCVAERVARHAPVPVFILREGGPTLTDSHLHGITVQHMLVPLDGSALAEAALAPAASLLAALAASSHGTLHLARIVHPDEVKHDAHSVEAAHRYLTSVVARHALDSQTICSVVIDTDVAPALLTIAGAGRQAGDGYEGSRCELLSLATHGRSGVQRLVLGSVTERLLSAAKLPMLVVHPQVQAVMKSRYLSQNM